MKREVSSLIKLLYLIGKLIPSEKLKTSFYLMFISKPRKLLRNSINHFYRHEHIYEVIEEFNKYYYDKFSILEFGVADGYSFVKHLYATKYLKMTDRIMVHGFDTFEGLPERDESTDGSPLDNGRCAMGLFRGRYHELLDYCSKNYSNFKLHKGLFQETITESFLELLKVNLPILIWIDCNYYVSTISVFKKLMPYIPTGCVVYFDDIDYNFSSRFTGEMRAIWEINSGVFGSDYEFVLDSNLSCDSNRVYRFINLNGKIQYRIRPYRHKKDPVRLRGDGSPFP